MNAPLAASLLSAVDMAPRDPILGVTEAFVADTNPKQGEPRRRRVLRRRRQGAGARVRQARGACARRTRRAAQLPADRRHPGVRPRSHELLLGADSPVISENRGVTVQALGGTGALKVGADFLRKFAPGAQVWISDPSWENHRALFEGAGFTVDTLPVLRRGDPRTRFPGMIARSSAFRRARSSCCTRAATTRRASIPTREQWGRIIDVVRVARTGAVPRHRVPGIRRGHRCRRRRRASLRRDARTAVRRRARSPSRSRSMASAWARCRSWRPTGDEAARVLSQLKRVVRANYSNPPSFGGEIVATVLESPELRALWEPSSRRCATASSRCGIGWSSGCTSALPGRDFRFMLEQRGMFSYSGLTKAQVQRLREEFSIYAVDTGRICVAALNSRNIDYVADAIGNGRGASAGRFDSEAISAIIHGYLAGIAQLVERNLAKVEVGSSRLLSRSRFSGRASRPLSLLGFGFAFPTGRASAGTPGGVAEWSCSGLQSRVRRFDSDPRLHSPIRY